MAYSLLAAVATASTAALFISYLITASRKGLRSVPGPVFASITGFYRLSMVWRGDAIAQYRKVHKKYGHIVRVGPNHVSISDPAMINTIFGVGTKFLKTDFYNVVRLSYKGEPMHSTFSTQDPVYHKGLRAQVASIYSMSNIKKMESAADECAVVFMKALQELEGQPIDIAAWLHWYAFDVIANITFRRTFGFMEAKGDFDNMIAVLNMVQIYGSFVGQFPWLHEYMFGNQTVMKLLKLLIPNMPDPLARIIQIAEEQIALYDSSDVKDARRGDFVAQIRASRDRQLPIRDVVNHLANHLLAGSDTTAISLTAVFYYLIKTPHAYQKLQQEIDDADHRGNLSELPTYDETVQLPYLNAVIKEAMRLHPGVGFPLERFVPSEGAVLCGVSLPGGTNVGMAAPVIHQDQSVFGKDAEDFRPERWLDTDQEKVKLMDKSFLAFGHGSRTCSGKNISLMEMSKFVPLVLRRFDLEWASPRSEWTTYCYWFWKQSDVIVRFRSRSTAQKQV